jgi:hypothetical protein
MASLHDVLTQIPSTPRVLVNRGDVDGVLKRAAAPLEREYRWHVPDARLHRALVRCRRRAQGRATVWTSSQSVFELRGALAGLLGLAAERGARDLRRRFRLLRPQRPPTTRPPTRRFLSRAVGRPVRVQWMRHDEHGHEPKGPRWSCGRGARSTPTDTLAAWDYAVWTPTHARRPAGRAGNLLAGEETGALETVPRVGGGDRNAQHGYTFPSTGWSCTSSIEAPCAMSALRGLGAPANIFAGESFVDELGRGGGSPIPSSSASVNTGRTRARSR